MWSCFKYQSDRKQFNNAQFINIILDTRAKLRFRVVNHRFKKAVVFCMNVTD